MTTSHVQQQSAGKSHHAWERWMPLWYGVFYVALIVSTILALVTDAHTWGEVIAIPGLAVVLGAWYVLCITVDDHYWQRRPLIAMGYLAVGWSLWFGLMLLDPFYLFVLFGLYPQIFFFRPMPWKIIDTLILTALSVWRQLLFPGGFNWSLLITLAATACGIMMTLFIEAIIQQSQERHQLISELEATRQELASAERQAGVTEERQRLAREIHDTLAQGFTSIVMHLEAAEGALPSDLKTLQRHLDQARRTARENLAEARRLTWALQPEALDRASLPEVLTHLADRWSEESGVAASATTTGTAHALRPEIEVTVLRAAQEALNNARKYARASLVTVTLSYMDDMVVLDVQDNGIGFDAAGTGNSPVEHANGGFGLKALRERVEQLNGTLSIESVPGEGTTIAVALPALSNRPLLCPEVAEEVG